MKLISLLIMNNATAYGGVQTLRRVVLFVWLGNPIVYKGNTFNWEQGRKLVSGTLNGNSFAYHYDGNGMRFEKTVNGVGTCYYYNGSQLLMESKNGSRTWYIYGVTGIEGMIVESGWQDSIYYFDKNTLGDIVAIRDESGNIVATYSYDAWGNCTVCDEWGDENTNSSFIGNINPFRYRGYYYDNETGFYYLQTRYYDPTICRFINADNYELVAELSQTVGQLNLYAYANNNPIMYTDETGEGLFLIISLIVGAVAGAIIGGVTAACNGAEGWGIVGGIALGAVLGTAGGALFASGSTAGYIAVRGSLLSATKLLSLKRSVALGMAIFDIIGSIAGPLLGVDWELVEWGPGTPENTPNKTPYSDISGMSTTALAGKYNIAKYYAV